MSFDGVRNFTYSPENLLTGATGGVALAYDPLGRLYATTGNPDYRNFLYDGDRPIAEYDYGGALVARYIHGAGIDEPVYAYAGGTGRYLIADERGSIIAQADNWGNVTGINSYDEYGVPASTNAGRFQYTGQAWLPEIGLYYCKARMYHPKLGRFMQTDPIGYAGGMNVYNYVGSDPVNFTDPTGLEPAIIVTHCGINRVFDAPTGRCIGDRGWNGSWIPENPRSSLREMRDRLQSGHRYPFEGRLTPPNTNCTIDQVIYALNFYAIPGSDGPKLSGQSYTARATLASAGGYELNWRLGDVSFQSESGGLQVRNTTLGNHQMRWGSVEMRIIGSQQGGYSIAGIGYGSNLTALHGLLNQALGPSAFNKQIAKMAKVLKQCN